jgi:hypothetical protein
MTRDSITRDFMEARVGTRAGNTLVLKICVEHNGIRIV